jgi:hypothetical protein
MRRLTPGILYRVVCQPTEPIGHFVAVPLPPGSIRSNPFTSAKLGRGLSKRAEPRKKPDMPAAGT